MKKEECDKCEQKRELQPFNVVNVDTNYVVAIIELCKECTDSMEKEGRITRD